jgi:proline iminopeptidase
MKKCIFLFLVGVISLAHAQDFEGLKKLNGTSLYLKIMGKGEPLVIVHGGPGLNSSYFFPHLDVLAKRHKLVFYDQRASGKSATPSPDSISLKFFADDLEAIRQLLGVEKLTLLAHSWGAIPAVQYAIAYPGHVKGIIFCNPVPLSHEFDLEMKKNQQKIASDRDTTDRSIIIGSKAFKAGDSEAYKKVMLVSFRHAFYTPANFSELRLTLPANYMTASQALYTGLSKDLGDYNFYEPIKSFAFPVLVMQGAADAIPLSASVKLHQCIPKATLEVFKKSGHFIFIEENGKFRSSVERFMGK